MLNRGELEKASMAFDKKLHEAENEIFNDIIRRIKINKEITRSADWQIKRLREFGVLQEEINRILKEKLAITDEELQELFSNVAESNYVYDKEIYEAAGAVQVPIEQNAIIQQTIAAAVRQTSGEIQNLSQSIGLVINRNSGREIKSLTKYYQDTLDKSILQIATGMMDYNTAVKKASREMSNSGLRKIDYESGYTSRIDVAARRAILTGIGQMTGKISEANADSLNTEYFETEFHFGARPSHQLWQGRVWSKDELYSVCGLGEVDGLLGANCYHTYYPFIPGVSVRKYTDKQLDEMYKKEQEVKTFEKKCYTVYEALQKQRSMETKMRALRQRIVLMKSGQIDEKTINAERTKYRKLSAEYSEFSEFMGLPEQRERIYIDGLGRV